MKNTMFRKAGSASGGKKIFLLVPIIALIAAGCGSPQSEKSNNSQLTPQQSSNVPANMVTTSTSPSMNPTGSIWQGTLMISDNASKGNYMITVGGHTMYLRTSRDFSALVGKAVNINYSGDTTNFVLNDITAQ